MVSKLNILARYYQIYLEELNDDYFEYQGVNYYLSGGVDEQINKYYQFYLAELGVVGFKEVSNCFSNIESEGFVLYQYEFNYYSIDMVIRQSLIPINQLYGSIEEIKVNWCTIIDNARRAVPSHASRINHNEYYVILSYYYQGIAENAINILNEIIGKCSDNRVPIGLQHIDFYDDYKYLFNPTNLILSTRVRNISFAYKKGIITIDQLDFYISNYNFSEIELMYIYARVIFPSEFFKLILNTPYNEIKLKEKLVSIYYNIDYERESIINLYHLLSKYVYVPKINWFENMSK